MKHDAEPLNPSHGPHQRHMRRLVELCNDNVAEGAAEPQIAEELFCIPLQMCKVIRRTKGTSYQTHVEMD